MSEGGEGMSVVVVGGGMMGAATAYYLTRPGTGVARWEGGGVDGGTC